MCSKLAQQYDRHDYGNGAQCLGVPRDLSHREYEHSERSVRTQRSLYVMATPCFTSKKDNNNNNDNNNSRRTD